MVINVECIDFVTLSNYPWHSIFTMSHCLFFILVDQTSRPMTFRYLFADTTKSAGQNEIINQTVFKTIEKMWF